MDEQDLCGGGADGFRAGRFEDAFGADGFWLAEVGPIRDWLRLAWLAGDACPRCGERLIFDGFRLRCERRGCGYTWNNPDAAEDEICR